MRVDVTRLCPQYSNILAKQSDHLLIMVMRKDPRCVDSSVKFLDLVKNIGCLVACKVDVQIKDRGFVLVVEV